MSKLDELEAIASIGARFGAVGVAKEILALIAAVRAADDLADGLKPIERKNSVTGEDSTIRLEAYRKARKEIEG